MAAELGPATEPLPKAFYGATIGTPGRAEGERFFRMKRGARRPRWSAAYKGRVPFSAGCVPTTAIADTLAKGIHAGVEGELCNHYLRGLAGGSEKDTIRLPGDAARDPHEFARPVSRGADD